MEMFCQELDDLVINYIDTLDEIKELRQRMHTALEQGFYNLSKARYSMGEGQVGALQYDNSRMRAQAHIKLSESQDGKLCTFLLEHQQVSQVTKAASLYKGESHLGSSGDDITSDVQDPSTIADFEHEDDEEPPVNPLRWFGILVPSTLRQCQSDFINAIQECAHLASLEKQLPVIRDQYISLQKKMKQEVLSCDINEMVSN